ncbi:MAG: acylglycerol kinase family protein, partial [Spirochaetaceae bacterium]|nr:acylglycerol kinase family protein [Spirochaetaceae bacterium]
MNISRFEEFASALEGICNASPLVQDRPLLWTCIANPKAGGFTIGSRWKKHRAALESHAGKAGGKKRRGAARPSDTSRTFKTGSPVPESPGLILTSRPGDAGDIVRALLAEASSSSSVVPSPFFLIITAGGDGTSLEVQLALYEAHPSLRSNFAILRLPMGTGNDGADAWEL